MRAHGYALLALEYNNAFIAPRELPALRPLDAEDAYRRGYLERPDRRERFQRNHDMEALHTLSPAEAVNFIKKFFAAPRRQVRAEVMRTERRDRASRGR